MKKYAVSVMFAPLFFYAPHAFAYGTIHGAGQNAEHERITRRALACGDESAHACLEKETLDELTGKRFSFGGVGYPDDPRAGMMSQESAHCDGGDFLDVPGYPTSREDAEETLTACRDWARQNFEDAVAAAGGLLDEEGALRTDETSLSGDCIGKDDDKKGDGQSVKCSVLTSFGIMLHAVQDFYSHSNWTDIAIGETQGDPRDAPGLENAGPALFLGMGETPGAYPEGLISGCYEGLVERLNCNYRAAIDGKKISGKRVKHDYLNKDKGVVDPEEDDEATEFESVGRIGEGSTDRGKVNDNFARSVNAAILDTRGKLEEFSEALTARYGAEKGDLILCAIVKDNPESACQ